jgi:hypothetical protein
MVVTDRCLAGAAESINPRPEVVMPEINVRWMQAWEDVYVPGSSGTPACVEIIPDADEDSPYMAGGDFDDEAWFADHIMLFTRTREGLRLAYRWARTVLRQCGRRYDRDTALAALKRLRDTGA